MIKAITKQTAAEIIYYKADHEKEHMGLMTWKNSPDGRILKSDVTVAKNYLNEKQIRQLERAVTGYFDYIEDLNRSKGKISRQAAWKKAQDEYDIFNRTQKIYSDFDEMVEEVLRNGE